MLAPLCRYLDVNKNKGQGEGIVFVCLILKVRLYWVLGNPAGLGASLGGYLQMLSNIL